MMLKKIRNFFSNKKEKNIELKENVIVVNLFEDCEEIKKAGNVFLNNGDFLAAEQCYRKAVLLDDSYVDGHMNLGWVLVEQKKYIEAEKELKKVLSLNENHFDALYVLGKVYETTKMKNQAIECFSKILKIRPEFIENHIELSNIFLDMADYEKVIEVSESGLKSEKNGQLYFNLGVAWFKLNDYDKSLVNYNYAIDCGMETQSLFFNLGIVYYELGNLKDSTKFFNKAKEINEDVCLDSILNATSFIKYYYLDHTLEKAFIEANDFNAYMQKKIIPYNNFFSVKKNKIKIGFVSGDFKHHPVMVFLSGVLKNIDKSKFELYAYQTGKQDDEMTQSLKQCFYKWTKIFSVNDIAKVYNDNIDILIDLSGHTGENGLLIFAKKAAKKQVTWLGYWGTTGLDTMDYIIADKNCLYENEQKYFKEKFIYMPETRMNFHSPKLEIEITNVLPLEKNKYVTFGCYQNLLKINDDVLNVWKKILDSIPNSIIKIKTQQFRNELSKEFFLQKLKSIGVDDSRIIVSMPNNREDYLKSYNEIDILLDTFPYTGGTTTCEAIWMGVPTITLNGETMIARQGASMLNCVELKDWIVNNQEDYINKAIEKSKNIDELKMLRKTLRENLLNSSLGNSTKFTKDFENVLFKIYGL